MKNKKNIIEITIVIILLVIVGTIIFNFKSLTHGYGIINLNDEIIIDFNKYSRIDTCENCNLIEVENHGKYFFINLDNGKKILNNMYLVNEFSEGYGVVSDGNSKYYYINENGEIVSDGFERAEDFVNGIAPVKSNGKWGFVDKNFNILIDCIFDDAAVCPDNSNVLWVELNNKHGLIDKQGCFLIEPKYDIIFDCSSKLFGCSEDGKFKIKDYNEKTIVTNDGELRIVNEDEIIVRSSNKYGLIDDKCNWKISMKYDELETVNYDKKSLYIAKQNDKYGVIDENENIIINFEYDKINGGDNGIFKVYKEDLNIITMESGWGLIGVENGQILNCNYYEIDEINQESKIYHVRELSFNGLIDITTGEKIREFDDAVEFQVKNTQLFYDYNRENGKYGITDINGNQIIECKYDDIYGINDTYLEVSGYNYKIVLIFVTIIIVCLISIVFLIRKILKNKT